MKLKFLNPEVKVDKKNRVVVFKYTCEIDNYLPILDTIDISRAVFGYNKYIYDKFYVVGIARCHANDTFDVNIGTKLAETRARQKAYKIAWRKASKLKTYLYDVIEELDKFTDSIDYYNSVEYSYENSLINAEDN